MSFPQFVEEQAIDRVHRLTQKTNVIVYKITIADSVEERILELQEKKRELANQAIEGGKNQNAGKLGMKEIMQLFRRDAEHAPLERGDVTSYTALGKMGGILNSPMKNASRAGSETPSSGAGGSDSNENSVLYVGERKLGPTKIKPKSKAQEDSLYGRRW